jgi:hypothetical protein
MSTLATVQRRGRRGSTGGGWLLGGKPGLVSSSDPWKRVSSCSSSALSGLLPRRCSWKVTGDGEWPRPGLSLLSVADCACCSVLFALCLSLVPMPRKQAVRERRNSPPVSPQ